jgi:pyridoxal phosphate enzyme (YggS family)
VAFIKENYHNILSQISGKAVLVAVSKTRSAADIMDAYNEGHRDFGENYVQELAGKFAELPKDIRWHFIGHLQTNKIKQIISFVHLVHGVDSEKLLKGLNKEANKINRVVNCLLQVHIATEETKFGFDEQEISNINFELYPFLHIKGLMGMATFTDDQQQVIKEFRQLKNLFEKMNPRFSTPATLSMGMSADYQLALKEGSNMVRIGSLVFGERQ